MGGMPLGRNAAWEECRLGGMLLGRNAAWEECRLGGCRARAAAGSLPSEAMGSESSGGMIPMVLPMVSHLENQLAGCAGEGGIGCAGSNQSNQLARFLVPDGASRLAHSKSLAVSRSPSHALHLLCLEMNLLYCIQCPAALWRSNPCPETARDIISCRYSWQTDITTSGKYL